MKKECVHTHNWGSYETDETIKKFTIHNIKDIRDYLLYIVPYVLKAKSIKNYQYYYDDNTVFQINIKN